VAAAEEEMLLLKQHWSQVLLVKRRHKHRMHGLAAHVSIPGVRLQPISDCVLPACCIPHAADGHPATGHPQQLHKFVLYTIVHVFGCAHLHTLAMHCINCVLKPISHSRPMNGA
jgi:hypothetical protein